MMILQMSRMLERYIVAGRLKWLMLVSASSYIIYLFHTTFEGFVKSLVQQVPLLANGNDPLYFSVGAAAVIGAGIFLPIILHRYILQRNRLLRFLFGLNPAK